MDAATTRPAAPRADFLNQENRGKSVCFLFDASGALAASYDDLRRHISTALSKLEPEQLFVIVFAEADRFSASDMQMVQATPENLRRAEKFLGAARLRGGNPIPMLKFAAKLKPDLVYLMCDGDFEGPGDDAVVEFCKRHFAASSTRMSTIAFVTDEFREKRDELEFVLSLKTVAKLCSGQFTYAFRDDVSR